MKREEKREREKNERREKRERRRMSENRARTEREQRMERHQYSVVACPYTYVSLLTLLARGFPNGFPFFMYFLCNLANSSFSRPRYFNNVFATNAAVAFLGLCWA